MRRRQPSPFCRQLSSVNTSVVAEENAGNQGSDRRKDSRKRQKGTGSTGNFHSGHATRSPVCCVPPSTNSNTSSAVKASPAIHRSSPPYPLTPFLIKNMRSKGKRRAKANTQTPERGNNPIQRVWPAATRSTSITHTHKSVTKAEQSEAIHRDQAAKKAKLNGGRRGRSSPGLQAGHTLSKSNQRAEQARGREANKPAHLKGRFPTVVNGAT